MSRFESRPRAAIGRDAGTLVSRDRGCPGFTDTDFEEFDVAAVCDVCGKGPGFGMSVSHSHRRTHRRWNPNIQTVRTRINGGNLKRLNVCTSCLKAGKVTRG
jgi:large subunit ribosomal protein L28